MILPHIHGLRHAPSHHDPVDPLRNSASDHLVQSAHWAAVPHLEVLMECRLYLEAESAAGTMKGLDHGRIQYRRYIQLHEMILLVDTDEGETDILGSLAFGLEILPFPGLLPYPSFDRPWASLPSAFLACSYLAYPS